MPSFQIFPEANLQHPLRGNRCGDVSHSSRDPGCSHTNRYFVFEQGRRCGIFVHAGCEAIELERKWDVGPNIARMLDSLPRPLAYRNKVDEYGVKRHVAPSVAELEEYSQVARVVAQAQVRAQMRGSVDRAPPPAPKPQCATPVTSAQTTSGPELSDVQMMDNFLSGPSSPPPGSPLTHSNLKRAQAAREPMQDLAKAPAVHKQKTNSKPRPNPYDLLTSQKAATNLDRKPVPLKLTSTRFLYEDGDIINTSNLPSNHILIDLTDKPTLEKVLLDHLLCSDLCHEGQPESDECIQEDFCVIVDWERGYGTLIHKGSSTMRKNFEAILAPEHMREVYKALSPGRKSKPRKELSEKENGNIDNVAGRLAKLAIDSNLAEETKTAEMKTAAESKTSAPIDIKKPSTSTAPSDHAQITVTSNSVAMGPSNPSFPHPVQKKSTSTILREKDRNLADEVVDPVPLTTPANQALGAKTSKETKGEGEVAGESKGPDGVREKIIKRLESKFKAVNSEMKPAAPKESVPPGHWGRDNALKRLIETIPKDGPRSNIPRSKPSVTKPVKSAKTVVKTDVPKEEQKVAKEDEDEDWEAVDMDEAIESEYDFL